MAQPNTPASNTSATSGESKTTPATPAVAPASAPISTAPATAPSPAAPDPTSFGAMLDDLAKKPAATPAPAPVVPELATPATAAPAAPAEKPVTLSALPPSAPADEDDSHKFKTNAELRKEFYARSKALKEREVELAKVREELGAAKTPREDDEKKALAEKLSSLEKELSVREVELRQANYIKSREYQEKFEKPYRDVLTKAGAVVSQFTFTAEDGTSRKLTDNDFSQLLALPLQQAWEVADKLFGRVAPQIMGYREKLEEITAGAQEETKRYREQGAARDKDAMAAQVAQREGLKKHWQGANERLARQYPEFFAPDEKDSEGNEWLQKGFEYVDRIFQSNGMTPEQRIEHEADVRNRAAAFGRETYRRRKVEARVKELEEELTAYRESTPKRGERDGGGSAVPVEVTFGGEIDKIANGR